jgi:hypothetical protein
LSITEEGFQVSYEIELMLDALGSHIFVNSIEWVPNSLNLAVVCNAFVKIYDFSVDVLAPWACYQPDDGDFFTSVVFSVRDEDPAMLLATASGRVALQIVDPAGSDGPVYLTHYLDLPAAPNGLPIISAGADSGLLFLSALDFDIIACKLEDAVSIRDTFPVVRIALDDKIPWRCVHNAGGLHFFVNPYSTALMTIEITDDSFEIVLLTKVDRHQMQRPLRTAGPFLSYWIDGAELRMIAGPTGRSMSFVTGGENSDDEEISETVEFSVPAQFWATSQVTNASIQVSGDFVDGNGTSLLHHNRVKFNSSGPRVLRVRSTDPGQVIIGFKLSLEGGFRPPWVRLHDRKVIVQSSRAYMLALKRSEISNEDIVIEFGANPMSDTTCECLAVFVVDKSEIGPPVEEVSTFDWMTEATNLFDYADGRTGKIKGPLVRLQNLCSWIVNPNGEELDEATITGLVNLMYTNPDSATFCRRMIVKGVKDREKGLRIWAAELRRLVLEKAVHKQAWELVWRDLALLPGELRREILSELWTSEPEFSGYSAVLCAFFPG